jgi:hypothetical protein
MRDLRTGRRSTRLTLEVYPDAAGGASGVLYEDDAHSFDYEQGVLVAERTGTFEPSPRAARNPLEPCRKLTRESLSRPRIPRS